jgi:DNA transformation protein and related proteins
VNRLAELPGLGPKSQAMLAAAGITSLQQLQTLGSVRAFAKVRASGTNASLNLLWALEGALSNQPWQQVAREHRTSLLLALEQCEMDNHQLQRSSAK